MKFSDLIIEGNEEEEKLYGLEPIHWQCHYVIEIFMNFLPKIELDGSKALFIYLKAKPFGSEQYDCDKYFHNSVYYADEMYHNRVKELTKETKSEFYLGLIMTVLKDIAKRNGKEELFEIFDQTAEKVRECGFDLTLAIKKFPKLSKDRRYKAIVYRHINIEGEMWYVEIIDKNKNVFHYDLLPKPAKISKEVWFFRAYWEDEKFIITDNSDLIMATINAETQEIDSRNLKK